MHLLLRDHQGGRETNDVIMGWFRQQALAHQGQADVPRVLAVRRLCHHCVQQTFATHSLDHRVVDPCDLLPEELPHPVGILPQSLLFDHL